MKNSKAKALTAVSAMAVLAMMFTPAMATEPNPAPTADPAVAVPGAGTGTGSTEGTEASPGTEDEATAEQPLAFNLPYFKIFKGSKEGYAVTLTDVVPRNTPEEQAKWDANNCHIGLVTGNEGNGAYFVDARIICGEEEGDSIIASLKDSGGYKVLKNNATNSDFVSFSIPNFANFADGETVIEFNEATGKVVVLEPKEKPVAPKDESGAPNNGGNKPVPAPAPAPVVDKANTPGKADVKAPVAVKEKETVVTETPQVSGKKKLAETGVSATLLAMASVLGIGGTGLVGFSRRRK